MINIHPQYLVDGDGNRRSVLLDLKEFEELLECAEDTLDARDVDRLRTESEVSWDSVKAERQSQEP